MASTRRNAFTLVELLVAMALTMFVMVILTQAFVTSLEVFSGLKAIGDMQANLRTVTTLLQEDLQADHFEGKRRLSDPDLLTMAPRQGFFAMYQASAVGSANYTLEGDEAGATGVGMHSHLATNHVLYFTVKARGNQLENIFSVPVPAGSPLLPPNQTNFFNQPPDALYYQGGNFFNSPWAEVAYFLVQTGSIDEPSNPSATGSTPLYALYRCQYLLVPNPNGSNGSNGVNQALVAPAQLPNYSNLSCFEIPVSPTVPTAYVFFNAPEDVTSATNRVLSFQATTYPAKKSRPVPAAGVPPEGASVLLSNVVSFQVQVFKQGGLDFEDLSTTTFPATFDSAAAGFTIRAIRVTIRLWDTTTKQSRQITIVQDM